jgi:hypothetical protein
MMLVSYLECGFSLLSDRKSFRTRGILFYSETRKKVNTFLSMIDSFEPTLTRVKCVLPSTFVTTRCCLILTARPVAGFFIEHGQRVIVSGLRVFVRIAYSG